MKKCVANVLEFIVYNFYGIGLWSNFILAFHLGVYPNVSIKIDLQYSIVL